MAGGIDLTGYDIFPGVGGVSGSSGAGSLLGSAGALASGNPWVAGLQLLGSSGLLGGSKTQNTSSAAYSGIGGFTVDQTSAPVYNKPFFDLENPVHILVAGLLIAGGVYMWRKFK